MSLKRQERRLGREPTFRARQRDGSMFKKQGSIQSPGTREGGRCATQATLTLGEWNGIFLVSPVTMQGRSVILLVSSVSHLILGSLNRLQ